MNNKIVTGKGLIAYGMCPFMYISVVIEDDNITAAGWCAHIESKETR